MKHHLVIEDDFKHTEYLDLFLDSVSVLCGFLTHGFHLIIAGICNVCQHLLYLNINNDGLTEHLSTFKNNIGDFTGFKCRVKND